MGMRVACSSILVLAVLLAGCSSGGKTSASTANAARLPAAYHKRLASVQLQERSAYFELIRAVVKARKTAQLRHALLGYANEQTRIGTAIGLLHPPARAAKANALLSKGYKDEGAQLKALLPRLRAITNPHLALILIERNQPRGRIEEQRATAELGRLGFVPRSSSSSSASGTISPRSH